MPRRRREPIIRPVMRSRPTCWEWVAQSIRLSPDGQVELSRNLQIATAAIDASGMCLFVAFAVLDDPQALEGLCELLAAHTGKPFTSDELMQMGKRGAGAGTRLQQAGRLHCRR